MLAPEKKSLSAGAENKCQVLVTLQRKELVQVGEDPDSPQLSLPSATGEEQLFTLKDNVNIKSMGLISHEYIYDGEVFQPPEYRGSGMGTTGENNLIWRWRTTNLWAQETHMADKGSRKWKGDKHSSLPSFLPFFFLCVGCCYIPCVKRTAPLLRAGKTERLPSQRKPGVCHDGWYLLLQQRTACSSSSSAS